jgi:hypothetical protein
MRRPSIYAISMILQFEEEEWSILHSEVRELANIAISLTMPVSIRHWSVGRQRESAR